MGVDLHTGTGEKIPLGFKDTNYIISLDENTITRTNMSRVFYLEQTQTWQGKECSFDNYEMFALI